MAVDLRDLCTFGWLKLYCDGYKVVEYKVAKRDESGINHNRERTSIRAFATPAERSECKPQVKCTILN